MTTTERYIEAVGRRKCATARVRITPAKKSAFIINNRDLDVYFSTTPLQNMVKEALSGIKEMTFSVSAKVMGGGLVSQSEAIRLGIARALIKDDINRRKDLKAAGYLKRDPRVKERKKFGLRSARRAPQWSKR